jgi:hypothetical protein
MRPFGQPSGSLNEDAEVLQKATSRYCATCIVVRSRRRTCLIRRDSNLDVRSRTSQSLQTARSTLFLCFVCWSPSRYHSMLVYLHRNCSIYIQLSLRAEPLTIALEDAANLLYSVCRWPGASRNDTRHPLYSPRNIHGSSFIASTNPQGAFRDRNITSRIAGSAFEQSWGRQPGKLHR